MSFLLVFTADPDAAKAAAVVSNNLLAHLTASVAAIGALGTAAYGVVDASKGINGGVSNFGFSYLERTLTPLFPAEALGGELLSKKSVFETLKANWINGVSSTDQQSIAKTLMKLRMSPANAKNFADLTGVSEADLKDVLAAMSTGARLTPLQTDLYARFDLILTTIVSQAYEGADQRYRNRSKLTAVFASIVLALAGAHVMSPEGSYTLTAIMVGVIATPLAPIAKNVSTGIEAGVKALQSWRG